MAKIELIPINEAVALLPARDKKLKPAVVIGTEKIRQTFDESCLTQAQNVCECPGVTDVVLNPDAHVGYGAPVGCVLVSPTHIYPGPVGVDIKCSMSLLQLNLPDSEINDPKRRKAIIKAITERTPTGAGKGQRSVKKSRHVSKELGRKVVLEGASKEVCEALGIPPHWANRCEDAYHRGHDGSIEALDKRLSWLIKNGHFNKFEEKIRQLGSYGSGNHFGECESVSILKTERAQHAAKVFGLKDGHVAFLSHCGSRGFGFTLANYQFRYLAELFKKRGIPYPANDKQLVYAVLGTPEADNYLDDMALSGNFATVNHLLINSLILEAFQEAIPGVEGELVYFISHNIARLEPVRNEMMWVHRKGATRAFPAGHPGLKNSPFYETGHPILLPGNPQSGSAVMVAEKGAELSCYSVNHGAGRMLGRRQAYRVLDQSAIDESFRKSDILTNCKTYPRDEAPAAYKDFNEVLRSVELAGLASEVARLKARFVIKDADKSYGGAA
jgi:tRNA-splicing ligase RtcB